ncbi:MAG: tRNA ((1)-)-methyltransferase [Candidatus Parcubacteria bacterium]|jgi:tRNA (guanine37-N1)-methyltransferase
MRFDILTIFPNIIDAYINNGVIGRAYNLKKKIDIGVHNIRDYTNNPHKKVDDTPFGGGAGMILQIEPIYSALKEIISKYPTTKKHVILTKAGGNIFDQNKAIYLGSKFDHIIFICGRYEGVDARVEEYLSNESLSIGKFVLTGGELPALVMLDAISRHIPEVLGNQESLSKESWTYNESREYPHYSRPATFIPSNPNLIKTPSPNEWSVPEVLISGNHKEIEKWQKDNTN